MLTYQLSCDLQSRHAQFPSKGQQYQCLIQEGTIFYCKGQDIIVCPAFEKRQFLQLILVSSFMLSLRVIYCECCCLEPLSLLRLFIARLFFRPPCRKYVTGKRNFQRSNVKSISVYLCLLSTSCVPNKLDVHLTNVFLPITCIRNSWACCEKEMYVCDV